MQFWYYHEILIKIGCFPQKKKTKIGCDGKIFKVQLEIVNKIFYHKILFFHSTRKPLFFYSW